MISRKLLSLLVSLFSICSIAVGQASPPAVAVPKAGDKSLVDKIIAVTKHEEYFIEYCTKKVRNFAFDNNWSTVKTSQVLGSIKFKYYSSTIYNSFADYSTTQLKAVLNAMEVLNKDAKNSMPMILTNSMMQNNLELFVEAVIQGKYITSD